MSSRLVVDPFIGKMGVFRVHQGTVVRDQQLFVGSGKRPFRWRTCTACRRDYVEVQRLVPGDIGAVAKVDDIEVRLRAARLARRGPYPSQARTISLAHAGLAVQTQRKSDEHRLFEVLHKLELEDPCFQVERHPTPTRP